MDKGISRRGIIQGAAGAGLAAAAGGVLTGRAAAAVEQPRNADFYDAAGKFQAAKARQAYFDMMKRFNYPCPPSLEKGLWAVDFSLGDFVNVGMGGIFWWNSEKHSYFGHEIYLLPGQMIVEHAHVKTEKAVPKMEAWHVRHGMIYTLGEGDPTDPMPVKLPASQAGKFITVKHCEPLRPGELRELNRPEARHFMIAGPEGAIVTEYATFHDGAALRFTNPGVKF